jgi:Na+/melibiose symporter-like transporter
MGPVPVVLLVLAILFAWRYPITRQRHRALRDELAAREV